MCTLLEALKHPEIHIRVQARLILECDDIDHKRETERLVRELTEWDEHQEQSRAE